MHFRALKRQMQTEILDLVIDDLAKHPILKKIHQSIKKRTSETPALFVSDRFYNFETASLHFFVELGAPESILKMPFYKSQLGSFYPELLRDLPQFEVNAIPPFTNSEIKKSMGGLAFSHILPGRSNNHNYLIAQFERFHDLDTKIIALYEVQKTGDKWSIVARYEYK